MRFSAVGIIVPENTKHHSQINASAVSKQSKFSNPEWRRFLVDAFLLYTQLSTESAKEIEWHLRCRNIAHHVGQDQLNRQLEACWEDVFLKIVDLPVWDA